MNIIIQKFGGTSVATPESRQKVISKIKEALEQGERPVVVVSAMGRKGAPYATDTLIDFVTENAGEMKDESYDLLLSCGEIISAVTLATLLEQSGIKAKAFTGGQAGIVTNEVHKNADLLMGKPELLLQSLKEEIVPVVAGFQGITSAGMITTLGRGGSDTTAAMLGIILKAKRIEIFTDVDGIMTADPRVYDKAKVIPEMTYHEVFQMADSGAKVIHPRAVEYAMHGNIPLVIKNTLSNESGTFIVQQVTQKTEQRVITSVAHRLNRIQFKIEDTLPNSIDLLSEIAVAGISIDLINIFPTYKVFTIEKSDEKALIKLLNQHAFTYEKKDHCAKVTVIGERMTGVPGVMSRILGVLNKKQIQVLQTADSLTTISCLIDESNVKRAVSALHETFNL